jgi:hypothetical protein
MTITLEQLGNNVYGFSGLADCPCVEVDADGSCMDNTDYGCATGTSAPNTTCPAGQLWDYGVSACYTPVAAPGTAAGGPAQTSPGVCPTGYLVSGTGCAVNEVTAASGAYSGAGGTLVTPQANGTYQVSNPLTGVSTIVATRPAAAVVAPVATSLISGISNTALLVGAGIAAFALILMSSKR